jgi:hypothetical protein
MIQRDAEREGTYMFTIVPSDAPLIVKPRHCCPVGPAQWSSTPVGAGGGALVEVACVVLAVEEGGGEPGDVRVHTWYLSGPHYHPTNISFQRFVKERKETWTYADCSRCASTQSTAPAVVRDAVRSAVQC